MNLNHWADGAWADGSWVQESWGAEASEAVTAIPGASLSGGYPTYVGRRRTREELERDRERFGIPQEVSEIITEVAERQVERLESDKQKRFDELYRELQLRKLEFKAQYLEEMNQRRERLIANEIAARIRLQQADNKMIPWLMVMGMLA